MQTKVETFTPEQAQKALATSPGNRTIKRAWVQSLSNIIVTKHWRLTGQPIIFDQFGRLMDGHHRLLACVAAGIPITVLVVRGSDRDNFPDIDNVVPRSFADVASLNGYAQGRAIAAIAQFVWAWQRGLLSPGAEVANQTKPWGYNAQVMLEVLGHYKSIALAVVPSQEVTASIGIRPSVVGGLMFLMKTGDPEMADEFWNAIRTGEMLGANDARKRLRDMALGWRMRQMRITPWEACVACIRAWNTYTDGETCKTIRYSGATEIPKLNFVAKEWQLGAIREEWMRNRQEACAKPVEKLSGLGASERPKPDGSPG